MRTRLFVSLISVVSFFVMAPFAAGDSIDPAQLGSQGFADIGTPTASSSPMGNINTATSFMIGDLVTTTANSGPFAGLPTQSFGSVSFSINSPTSLTFGNSVFGNFASTSITEISSTPGFVNFLVAEVWTPGTFGGVTGGPFLSDLRISFTQTPSHKGVISDSTTFTVVPEPSTYLMGLTGLAMGRRDLPTPPSGGYLGRSLNFPLLERVCVTMRAIIK